MENYYPLLEDGKYSQCKMYANNRTKMEYDCEAYVYDRSVIQSSIASEVNPLIKYFNNIRVEKK